MSFVEEFGGFTVGSLRYFLNKRQEGPGQAHINSCISIGIEMRLLN